MLLYRVGQHNLSQLIKAGIVSLVILSALFAPVSAASQVLIANKDVSADSLSREEISLIFLGETNRWQDGKPITIVIQEQGTTHRLFLRDILSRTPTQYTNYWRKQIFNGKAVAPITVANMQEVIEFVATHSGAVGYVSDESVDNSVKVITITTER
jgi:ABC-type phosphate transport system substrate-binding protein